MNDMTLQGLLNLGNSSYAKDAQFMMIKLLAGDSAPEVIINPQKNFESKLSYYEKAYNEDLTLKNNPSIRIIDFDFLESAEDFLTIDWEG